jgi:2-isopropylmalate synthase
MKKKIEIFDTTLRDGSQGEDVSLSLDDKLMIAERLDSMGFHYIEGGWPAPGNEKDQAFFKSARKFKFKNSQLVAFGSTQRPGQPASKDALLASLVEAQTKVVCIFGKSWDLHATKVLKVSLEENLKLISDSVAFLKKKRRHVFYDAEHFFDGYKANPNNQFILSPGP